MRLFWVSFHKEVIEAARSYKWIWVPAVFLLLGVMQPVMMYYLPDILRASGELPPEAAALITTPPPEEIIASTLSQFSTIGLLVLVLSAMNIVAGERTSGTTEMILSRSSSVLTMMTAKWAAMMSLLLLSFALGYVGAVYYTYQLIGPLEWGTLAGAGAVYAVWLAWIVTLLLPLGAVLRGPAAAFLSLGIAAALTLLASLLPSQLPWSPGRLSAIAAAMLTGESSDTFAPALAAVLLIILSTVAAGVLLRRRPLSAQA
ncbi:ABC transporter permease subunit [Paenibacillus cisolokensis]|uniref:ABC transporter permease subunit n=1 Tax=Paenibacillus cisolokensis TaxID=1658519 RepID=UPI003D2927C5